MRHRWNPWRRGVYASGGKYIVRFVDEKGDERQRMFDTLAEAREFRTASRLTGQGQADTHGATYGGGPLEAFPPKPPDASPF